MTKQKITPKTFEKAKFYTTTDASLAYIIGVIMPYVISMIIYFFATAISKNAPESLAYQIVSMLSGPIGFCITFFAFNGVRKISFSASKVKFKLKLWDYAVCIILPLVCIFGFQYLIGGVNIGLKEAGYFMREEMFNFQNGGYLVLAIIILALLPAIFEELVFRGIVLNGLKSSLGGIGAVMVSALMFALMHASLQQLVYPLVLGVVLGLVALRTGSTFASMIVHFLNNAIVVVLEYVRVKTGFAFEFNFSVWWHYVVTIVLVAVTVLIVYLIDRFVYKHSCRIEEQTGEKQKLPPIFWVALGVGVIAFVIGTVIGFYPGLQN